MPQKIGAHRPTWTKRTLSRQRSENAKFYNSAQWKTLRRVKLTTNPICECSFGPNGGSCGELAVDVHHIIDIADRWDLRLHLDNLMSLTKGCHSRVTNG